MTDNPVEIITGNENDLLPDGDYVEQRTVMTKYLYLPEATCTEVTEEIPVYVYEEWQPGEPNIHPDADTPCPCCGNITIPYGGDALAYICPICWWEIDLFIQSDDEPSDQNHGLTLNQARENYKTYGAVKEEFVTKRKFNR